MKDRGTEIGGKKRAHNPESGGKRKNEKNSRKYSARRGQWKEVTRRRESSRKAEEG